MSADRPTVPLRVRRGGSYRDLSEQLRRLYEERVPGDPQEAYERADGALLGTRRQVNELVEASGVGRGQPVVLDAEGLQVITGSAAHELLITWPGSEVVNAGEFVADSFAMAREHIEGR